MKKITTVIWLIRGSEMFVYVFLINLFTIYIPLIVLGILMPKFTKKTLLFGFVIPEKVSSEEEVIKLKNLYTRNYAYSAGLFSLIINIVSFNTENFNLQISGIFILLLILGANYLYVHKKAKELKKIHGWTLSKKQMVVVNTSKNTDIKFVSSYFFLIPLFISILTLIITIFNYSNLPSQIPINFDILGNPTTFREKGFLTAYSLSLNQIGMTGLFFGIYKVLIRVRPSIQAAKPKTSLKQNLIAKNYWAKYMLTVIILITLHFMYMQLTIINIITLNTAFHIFVNGLVTIVPMIGVIFVAFKTGQSGSRIKIDEHEEINDKIIDRDDDKFWKLGTFYYNKDDSSIFIEKRFGIGWTINFGHPIGILITIIISILIGISLFFSVK